MCARESAKTALAVTGGDLGRRGTNVLSIRTTSLVPVPNSEAPGTSRSRDDGALVITIDPAEARYFSVPRHQRLDHDTATTGIGRHSLNVNQSAMNPRTGPTPTDRLPTDPSVANWVSTGRIEPGTISIPLPGLRSRIRCG